MVSNLQTGKAILAAKEKRVKARDKCAPAAWYALLLPEFGFDAPGPFLEGGESRSGKRRFKIVQGLL